MQESPRRIVLASRSPRRQELAQAEGWRVTVVAPADEVEAGAPSRRRDESLEDYVVRLARAKAHAVAAMLPIAGAEGPILACDTLSEVHGSPLGKPTDREDARRMLQALSGRAHRVVTGVCLLPHPAGEPSCGTAESVLEMAPLGDEFLEWYLDSGMWIGKAGACGFQDERLPLRLVTGSPSNVVGLPLELVREMLGRLP